MTIPPAQKLPTSLYEKRMSPLLNSVACTSYGTDVCRSDQETVTRSENSLNWTKTPLRDPTTFVVVHSGAIIPFLVIASSTSLNWSTPTAGGVPRKIAFVDVIIRSVTERAENG